MKAEAKFENEKTARKELEAKCWILIANNLRQVTTLNESKNVMSAQVQAVQKANGELLAETETAKSRTKELAEKGTKKITNAIIRLWKSGTCRMRINDGDWNTLSFPNTLSSAAPILQTGDSEKVAVNGDWSRNTAIELQGRSPLPLNVQAITLEYQMSGK